MGGLIAIGGGWEAKAGYLVCFIAMAAFAVIGVCLQLFTRKVIATA
jgi:hypothetical protein